MHVWENLQFNSILTHFPFFLVLLFIVSVINTNTNQWKSFSTSLSTSKTFASSCFYTMQINVISTKPAGWKSSCCVSYSENNPQLNRFVIFLLFVCWSEKKIIWASQALAAALCWIQVMLRWKQRENCNQKKNAGDEKLETEVFFVSILLSAHISDTSLRVGPQREAR